MSDGITLDDVRDWMKQLEGAAISLRDVQFQLLASDYPTMPDENFIAMCKHPGARFIGGVEACNRMQERMKKLGIK